MPHRANLWPMNVTTITPFKAARRVPDVTAFHRCELSLILGLYGRMVAAGEWRDYGISSLPQLAVFLNLSTDRRKSALSS